MEIRSGRAFGNVEHSPDLAVREPFDIVQHDHGSLSLTELAQRLLKTPSQLIRLARITKRHGDGVRQLIRITDFSSSNEIERRVSHDSKEPRAKRLIRKKSRQRLVSVKKPILDRVFRVFVREHDGAADRIRPSLMQPHQ